MSALDLFMWERSAGAPTVGEFERVAAVLGIEEGSFRSFCVCTGWETA